MILLSSSPDSDTDTSTNTNTNMYTHHQHHVFHHIIIIVKSCVLCVKITVNYNIISVTLINMYCIIHVYKHTRASLHFSGEYITQKTYTHIEDILQVYIHKCMYYKKLLN